MFENIEISHELAPYYFRNAAPGRWSLVINAWERARFRLLGCRWCWLSSGRLGLWPLVGFTRGGKREGLNHGIVLVEEFGFPVAGFLDG